MQATATSAMTAVRVTEVQKFWIFVYQTILNMLQKTPQQRSLILAQFFSHSSILQILWSTFEIYACLLKWENKLIFFLLCRNSNKNPKHRIPFKTPPKKKKKKKPKHSLFQNMLTCSTDGEGLQIHCEKSDSRALQPRMQQAWWQHWQELPPWGKTSEWTSLCILPHCSATLELTSSLA